MKRILIAMLLSLPLAATAQDNAWEQADTKTQANTDEKYMAGKVPVIDGLVTFEATFQAPGKSGREIYDILLDFMKTMVKEKGQYEQSKIALEDPDKLQIIGSYQEQLVFKKKALEFDYTRLFYNLIADCEDGKATVRMTRIIYLYEEERSPMTFKAEESIIDRYGLNKKQTKLSKAYGKFRRKTIDRKDYLFNKIDQLLK